MGMGYDIRPEGRSRAVGYRTNYPDAESFALDRAKSHNRVMVIVDVSTGQAHTVVGSDGSVSLVPGNYQG